MKKLFKEKLEGKYRRGLALLLVAALVVSSLVLGLGQLKAEAVQATGQTIQYRFYCETRSQTCEGSGTNSNFKIRLTLAAGGDWYSAVIDDTGDSDDQEADDNNNMYVWGPAQPLSAIYLYQDNSNGGLWQWDTLQIFADFGTGAWILLGSVGGGSFDSSGGSINLNYNNAMNTTYNRTLTFNGNGGTVAGSSSFTVMAIQGATYPTSNNPTPDARTGYTYNGWSPAAPTSVCPQTNTTYNAQWSANPYTLTFDPQGGSVSPGSSTVNYNSNYGSGSGGFPDASLAGYTFQGWFTATGGGGTHIYTGTQYTTVGNSTIYAYLTINSHQLTVDPNGGVWSGSGSPQGFTQNYNTTKTIGDPDARTGWTFTGWSLSGQGTWNGSIYTYGPANGSTATLTAQWTLNSHVLTVNPAGGVWSGSGDAQNFSQSYNTTKTIDAPDARTGWTFNGWGLAGQGSWNGTTYTFGPANAQTATLTASWTINTYTITWDANGGTGGTTTYVQYNVTPTAPSVSWTGHTFQGWSPALYPADKNQTYTAQWTVDAYTITWAPNGGSGGGQNQCPAGQMPTPLDAGTKAGYSFSNWTPALYAADKDQTYTAQWTANTYYLVYDANGGSGTAMTNTGILYQGSGTVSTNSYTPPIGKIFAGWNTATDGSGNAYANGATFSSMPANNVTLYAQWSNNTYYLVYDANTGSGSMGNTGILYGGTGTVSTSTFTPPTGKSFAGWNTAANGLGTAYPNGASFGPMPANNVTLYAQWTANTYNLIYDKNTGTGTTMTNTPILYQGSGTVSTNTYTPPTGYKFNGWNTLANGTGNAYANGATFSNMPANNVTLYAQWSTNTYYLTYSANGGSGTAMGSTGILYQASGTVSTNTYTAPTGYHFTVWNTLANGTGTSYANGVTFSNMPANDVPLFAQWAANSYQVLFNNNGGGGIMSNQNFVYGTAQNLTANGFTKVGNTFTGWSKTPPYTSVEYTNQQSVSNLTATDNGTVTFYAVWQLNQYYVYYSINGGTGTTPSTVHQNFGSSVTLPSQSGFAYTGRTFYGWNTTTNAQTWLGSYSVPATDSTLYAVWGANYTAVIAAADLADNTTLPANATHDPGYMAPDGEWYVAAGFTNNGYYTRDNFTPASIAALEGAVNAVNYSQMSAQQATVTGYATAITTAYNNLELAVADYAPLQAKVNYVGTLTSGNYTTSSWSAVADAKTVAEDYIAAQYKKPLQPYVDEVYDSLVSAIDGLVWKTADYTGVTTAWNSRPTNMSLYTTASVAALNNYYGTIVWNLTLENNGQATVDNYRNQIYILIAALELKPADYSGVNNAIYNIPDNENTITVTVASHDKTSADLSSRWLDSNGNLWTLTSITNSTTLVFTKAAGTTYSMPYGNGIFTHSSGAAHTANVVHTQVIPNVNATYLRTIYTDTSVTNLAGAVSTANTPQNRARKIDEQATVNGYAAAIIAMTSALVPLDANYTYLDLALGLDIPVGYQPSYYTDVTYTAFNNAKIAGAAVPRNLNITQQQQIDSATALINATYTALALKAVTYTVKYQDAGTNMLAADAVHNATAADWITEYAVAVPGYTPAVPSIQMRLTGTNAENIFLFVYNINQYTVSFEENGGSTVTDIQQNYNTQVSAPAAPTKTGYLFAGWFTDAGLTTAVTWPHTLTANVTFYAKWTAITYTVTYDANTGAGTTANTQHTYAVPSNIATNGFTKTGNSFTGWNTAANGTGTAYTNGQSVTTLSSTQGATVTLYAVWQVNHYNITFAANGGTGGTGPTSMLYGATLTAPTVTKEGHTFGSWDPEVPATVPAADTTYTAQWNAIPYTVTFEANGGSAVADIIEVYGTPVPKPANPTKADNGFAGWYTDAELTTPVAWPHTITGDATFYAKWAETVVGVTKNESDLTVNIAGWQADYKYQIWSYQAVSSDIFESTGVSSNQWILSQAYALGSTGSVQLDGSINFTIADFTSPDENYTIAVRTVNASGAFVSEIRSSYTPAQVSAAVITDVMVDGSRVSGRLDASGPNYYSEAHTENDLRGPVIREITTGASVLIKVIGNANVTAYTATILETMATLTVSNTNEFVWDISGLAPRTYTIRLTASNEASTDTAEVIFTLYKTSGITYGEISSLSTGTPAVGTLPQSVSITPSFSGGNFNYCVREDGRSPEFNSIQYSSGGGIGYEFTKYGIYSVYGFVYRPGIMPLEDRDSFDDVAKEYVAVKRATGTSTASLNANPGTTVTKGTPITFTAGSSIAGIGSTPVQYSFWRYDAKGYELIKDWSTSNTLDWTPGRVGTYTVEVKARGEDAGSYEAKTSLTVNVTSNTEAKALGVVITVNEEELAGAIARIPIVIRASATAANGEDLLYKFNISDPLMEYQTYQNYSANPECVWTPREAGTYNINVLVKSSASYGGSDTVKTITVTVN